MSYARVSASDMPSAIGPHSSAGVGAQQRHDDEGGGDADEPTAANPKPPDQQRPRILRSDADDENRAVSGSSSAGDDDLDAPEDAGDAVGFSTEAALARLDEDIAGLLAEYEARIAQESLLDSARHYFQHPCDTPLSGVPILFTILTAGALLATAHFGSGVLLLVLLLVTIAVCVREHRLRRTELHRKVRHVLAEIRLARTLCGEWTDANYPNLCSPMSPCVTLQWTHRDGRIVNLPWALLVRGDLVVLRPGQVAPAACTGIAGQRREFAAGETYGLRAPMEPPLKPIARPPLPDLVCRLRETPYLDNLRVSLEKFDARPTTVYNQQRYLLVSRYVQVWACTVALLCCWSMAALREQGIGFERLRTTADRWAAFVLGPACAVLPILPLVFPLLWFAVNLWGVARLQTLLGMTGRPAKADAEANAAPDDETLTSGASLDDIDPADASKQTNDLDTPTYDGEWERRPLPRNVVFRCWWSLWRGDSRLLGRSANVVQVLGSITALCCVDKKGILSWPNPTAEKVFFLRNPDEPKADAAGRPDKGTTRDDALAMDGQPMTVNVGEPGAMLGTLGLASQTSMDSDTSALPHPAVGKHGVVAEVLDLTHDQHSAFRLAFDDHAWSAHLASLKPLGLAILMNTCCPLTQAHYAQFCNHVTAVAMLDKDLVPVTNRYDIVESRLNSFMHGRCLCELAKQIGFTDQARDIFQLEGQIASYMHLQPDIVRRDIRFARQLHLNSKVKVPFPHSLSVVMREKPGNSLQLLTQGTADIVLDCCDDYWDGHDLRPLTAQERKRAQDFYQRSALTAYCTAFAYRPLRRGISGALAGIQADNTAYLELPPEMRYRLKQQRTPSFTYDTSATGEPTAAVRLQHHSISTDSLLFETDELERSALQRRQPKPPNGAVRSTVRPHQQRHPAKANRLQPGNASANSAARPDDVDGCFEMQCHQVFIGMVTMQYQAQTDIVQLIERLDSACVRFVHFSKENELRSRVFSEKMGLESGWNCHISLLSSKTAAGSSLSSPKHLRAFADAIDDDPTRPIADALLLAPAAVQQRSASTASAPMIIRSTLPAERPDSTPPNSTDNSYELDDVSRHAHRLQQHRPSNDSAMEDENCRSLSSLTVSTEQSAPINFDMSNRAKLPRGIENIQPHLENVDNVPLLVSLFTDCSAEATRQMLGIMQRHGEIVVCLGSSASNANAEIFLQADCAIGVEPLYPQVCQDIAAYTETNLAGNRRRFRCAAERAAIAVGGAPDKTDVEAGLMACCADADDACGDDRAICAGESPTVSPVYLSRTLNTVACSISICRNDSLSIVALIELSRRFSNGLWSCIQFWASCACSLALINALCACVALPPLLTPAALLYLMCVAVPALAVTLVRTDAGDRVMNRATAKKHTAFDRNAFGFVLFCYGCKFLPSTAVMLLGYCLLLAHPVDVLDAHRTLYGGDFERSVDCARAYLLLACVLHYVCISTTFVHRDYSMWRRNPASNREWLRVVCVLLTVQALRFAYDALTLRPLLDGFALVWPIVAVLFGSLALVLIIGEMCKWEELKVNARAQRRARLDFGTKLGMNSPF